MVMRTVEESAAEVEDLAEAGGERQLRKGL